MKITYPSQRIQRSNLEMSDSGPIVQRIQDELRKKSLLDRFAAITDPMKTAARVPARLEETPTRFGP